MLVHVKEGFFIALRSVFYGTRKQDLVSYGDFNLIGKYYMCVYIMASPLAEYTFILGLSGRSINLQVLHILIKLTN